MDNTGTESTKVDEDRLCRVTAAHAALCFGVPAATSASICSRATAWLTRSGHKIDGFSQTTRSSSPNPSSSTDGLHVNPWTHFPRLITSVDYIKRERPMRLMREVLPPEGQPAFPRKFDLLIVDEAHNVAPSGRATSSGVSTS